MVYQSHRVQLSTHLSGKLLRTLGLTRYDEIMRAVRLRTKRRGAYPVEARFTIAWLRRRLWPSKRGY
jgi:hypothetical protein